MKLVLILGLVVSMTANVIYWSTSEIVRPPTGFNPCAVGSLSAPPCSSQPGCFDWRSVGAPLRARSIAYDIEEWRGGLNAFGFLHHGLVKRATSVGPQEAPDVLQKRFEAQAHALEQTLLRGTTADQRRDYGEVVARQASGRQRPVLSDAHPWVDPLIHGLRISEAGMMDGIGAGHGGDRLNATVNRRLNLLIDVAIATGIPPSRVFDRYQPTRRGW